MNMPLVLQLCLAYCSKDKTFMQTYSDLGLVSKEGLLEVIDIVNNQSFIDILNKSLNNFKQLESMTCGVVSDEVPSLSKEIIPPGVGYQMCKNFGSNGSLNKYCATECSAELRISCAHVTFENKQCYGSCIGSNTCMTECAHYANCYEDTYKMNICYGIGLPKNESFICSTCPVRNKCRAVKRNEVKNENNKSIQK